MKNIKELNSDFDYLESLGETKETSEDEVWHAERLGKFTSSKIGSLMSKGRGKGQEWGQMAMSYIYTKIAEKMTGVPHYTPETNAMQWGNDHEAEAIEKYNLVTENGATPMGKVFIKFNDNCGGSPDGFVGDDGVIEVKCPYNSANHIETFIERTIKKEYFYQCQGNMLFSDRKWCDFISYDPRMPEDMQLVIVRVERDDDVCNSIAERIEQAASKIIEIQEKTGIDLKF